jgi:DNA-binding winged helix-turn-helix (wHTH) protein/Tol biopolymer transport system component
VKNSVNLLTVGDFVLNTESRKLYDNEQNEVALAPTLFTLLKYFVDNQGQVLTKDMIMANVWKGKIVGEANVNQNLKKLRDALGDSATEPKYIETVIGEGFRFIANSEEYQAVPFADNQSESNLKYIYILLSAFVVIFVYTFYLKPEQEVSILKDLQPLTTLKGFEHYPVVSSDGKYLLFNHKKVNGTWDIYLKPINKESYKAIVASEANEFFPVISKDQKQLLYFVKGEDKCGLYVRDIDLESLSVGEPNEVKLCKSDSELLRAEWINNNEIFFRVNEDGNSQANIYHYELSGKKQTLISKPDTKGFGDYVLKYSDKNNKLAYIRNIGWASSEIWVYDLSNKSHRKIKSTPLLLHGIDWDNKERIYYQSNNKEISRININTLKEEVVAKFSSQTYLPFFIDEKSFGVAKGQARVVDIDSFSLDTLESKSVISSSFNDYFAAGGSDFVVFVSNRSGDAQVWLRDEQGNSRQLTQFDKSYEISWLSVSNTKDLIMFGKSGHINIIDRNGKMLFNSENYGNQIYKNPVFDMAGDSFIYSTQVTGEWNIETRKVNEPGDKTLLFKGLTARPCYKGDCIYYMKDKDPYLYKYDPVNNTSTKEYSIDMLTKSDEWDFLDENNIIYLLAQKDLNQVILLNLQTGVKKVLIESKTKMFSLDRARNLIYTNLLSQGNIDLMYFTL